MFNANFSFSAFQILNIHAPALVPATLAALPSIRRQPVSPYSVFQNGFRLCARAIFVAGAVLARLLRLVPSCDQAHRLLDLVRGAGLSFFAPEAP
jgi:hypothetical protein